MTLPNPITDAALQRNLAELTRVVDVPTGDLGYGVEPYCVTDITEDWADVDPATPQCVVYATIRRWTCPRGMLPDDLEYGRDVRAYCSRPVTPEGLRSLAQSLGSEAEKDDRVAECQVQLVASLATRTLDIRATITPADPSAVAFTFTFAVTDGQVLIDTIAVTTPTVTL